jgi:hypothetical protein
MRRVRRALELAPAALRLVIARLLLSTIGVARTRRLFERQRASRIDQSRAEEAARLVLHAAERLPLRTNCLDRAVALWWLLSSRGVAAALRVGVRKDGETTLAAHAWVEHDGAVLLDEEAGRFAALDAAIFGSMNGRGLGQ